MAEFTDPSFDAAVAAAGLALLRHPLAWYVRKLTRGEPFSLARYGDGELACMMGAVGANTDGDPYSEQLGDDLRYSLARTDSDFLYGLQRVLPEDVAKFRSVRPAKRSWVDSEVFGRELLLGGLYPLLNALRRLPVVLITNPDTEAGVRACSIFPRRVLHTPRQNTYAVKDALIAELTKHPERHFVYLFSCGLTAKVLIAELHGRLPECWLLDMGHLWDVFADILSREELKAVTPNVIRKNLTGR